MSGAAAVPQAGGLEVAELSVRYGGRLAVDAVSLRAPGGRITGLIGPNGAGKTTIFNACSGLVRPSGGRILLDGHDVTRLDPGARARRGLGRTFQRMELFTSMTVTENVALGREVRLAGASPFRQLAGSRRTAAAVRAVVADALDLCGIGGLADRPVGTLPTGQRRLVELARAWAGGYRLLLLDEPSSGLDAAETGCFGEILTRIVAEQGTGILLVEHDMALVMGICAELYVLDFGRMICSGPPAEVQASAAVRAAYLGAEGAVGVQR